MKRFAIGVLVTLFLLPHLDTAAQSTRVQKHYTKHEFQIPMRDGVKLFTSVYAPKDKSQRYPIMLIRTPYSVAPYGADKYRNSVGPSEHFADERFIFVYQDVRGKFMSEGEFTFMRPHNPNKKTNTDTDESSDTYDTIEWLVKNIPNNTGKVGIWGISYPGYQAAMSVLDAHPALVAVSPQAPMGDVFIGDDFHHNGAFFLIHAYRWLAGTAPARSGQEAARRGSNRNVDVDTPDGYEFFLNLGPIANVNKVWFKNQVPTWNEFMEHGTYDEYWKPRGIIQHFNNIKPAMMTVVGWFDTEDKYGGVHLYQKTEKTHKGENIIVWGPWLHGGWARMDGDTLGNISFSTKTGEWYRENIEFPFFMKHLKGNEIRKLPEATAFMTGANEWRNFTAWPPKEAMPRNLYLGANGTLSFNAPAENSNPAYDEYVSDPKKPVPFTAQTTMAMGNTYIVEDQRFAWSRPDVLVYQTEPLTEDMTIAGPMKVVLYGSTSGTDCDWVVKLIDVYPGDAPNHGFNPPNIKMGGYQMMLSGEVMRAKFRKSFENPEPVKPGEVTKIEFDLPDKLHRFKKGHKIMVQIQSTWFPLVDLNPGKFVDIYNATEADFQKTTQRVYRSSEHGTHLILGTIKE